jgi:hypothetical protein
VLSVLGQVDPPLTIHYHGHGLFPSRELPDEDPRRPKYTLAYLNHIDNMSSVDILELARLSFCPEDREYANILPEQHRRDPDVLREYEPRPTAGLTHLGLYTDLTLPQGDQAMDVSDDATVVTLTEDDVADETATLTEDDVVDEIATLTEDDP